MKLTSLTSTLLGLCLGLGLCFGLGFSLTAQESKESAQPTLEAQFRAALGIRDLPTKIKELKRIKAEYPDSGLSYSIDYNLLTASTRSAGSFGEMLAAQKDVIASSEASGRFLILVNAADMVLNHREASRNSEDVLKTIQSYRAEAKQLLDAPETFAKFEGEMRTSREDSYKNMFEISLAKALLMNGKGRDALNVLETYKKSAQLSPAYYMVLGNTYKQLKRDKDALEAYFEAAATGHGAATENARALYAKTHVGGAGFEKELERRKAERPFVPPPFRAPENWQGKTALAEVFTGSECAPCVAATFAFDALEKNYPTRYLAVLKYHLPIPLYDPMMNPATKKRQEYYRKVITGTPTAIIDGVASPNVGGYRMATEASFNRAKKEIDAAIAGAAEITLKANAAIKGDVVTVDCEFSKEIEGAEYNVVLVQRQEDFKGGNSVAQHNMVVRDFKSVPPAEKATVTFNIAESEKAADAYIAEWAKTVIGRNKQLSSTRRSKIDRKQLKAVVFVQDKKTKQVYNAFVAEVV
jgi:tetratricopeptide (TPR) repeat protein